MTVIIIFTLCVFQVSNFLYEIEFESRSMTSRVEESRAIEQTAQDSFERQIDASLAVQRDTQGLVDIKKNLIARFCSKDLKFLDIPDFGV